MQKKLFQRLLSILLILLLAGNSWPGLFVVYAEDSNTPPDTQQPSDPPPTPAVEPQSQEQKNDPPPSPPSSDNSSAVMVTGDAGAVGTSDVNANATEETTSTGSVSSDKNTVVEGKTEADATTGGNTTMDEPGDATQKTGTASATAISSTDLNTTVISLTGPTGSSGATGPTGATGGVTLTNSVTLETEASASATSGQNTEKNIGGDATIQTGGSYASAYSLNVINTTMLGTNVRFLVINIDGKRAGDIDLNALWKEIQKEQEGRKTLFLDGNGSMVDITNSSSSFTRVAATAISGENSVTDTGGGGTVVTGDAFASAGLINFQNTTIIESRILVVVINIYGDYIGDLIIPSSERFIEQAQTVGGASSQSGAGDFTNSLTVQDSNVSAAADSGTNVIDGASQIQTTQTGDAYGAANEMIFANTQYYIDYFYHILYNNFGSHIGGITGMENPQETTTATPFASSGYSIADSMDSGSMTSNPPTESNFTIANNASASYDVSALAKSGGNTLLDVAGDALIQTGKSIAIANVISFFNTTVFGNTIFLPVINLFGRWVGNLVFARPDLFVSITPSKNPVNPGDELEYVISYVNGGQEEARGTVISLELPGDMTYLSSSLSDAPVISGLKYQFSVGTVPVGVSKAFTVKVRLATTISSDAPKPTTFLETIRNAMLPKVMAADNMKFEIVNISIATSDIESDNKNNQAKAETQVVISQTVSSSQPPSYDVRVQVSNSNNANGFVYPGDTVHFTVNLMNDGASMAKDAVLTQTLENDAGQTIGTMAFPAGTILSKKSTTVSYDLTVPLQAQAGIYISKSSAVAYDESGKKTETNGGSSSFTVRLKELGIIKEVQAAEEVKGAETVAQPSAPCVAKKDYLPYILIAALLVLWFVEFMRRRRLERELDEFRKIHISS